MWSHARCSLRISSDEFWTLTPKQYHLLNDRHREELVHRETVAAITTAAIYNSSFNAPSEPVNPSEFIFNLRKRPSPVAPITPEQKADREAALEYFNASSVQLSIELKAFATTGITGPHMTALGIGCQKEVHAR